MQTAPLQGIAHFTHIVRGQEDQRRHGGFDGADFRNGDLIGGEDFQQKRFEFLVGFIDLIDQQHRAVFLAQGLQQGAGFEEFLGKEHIAEAVQFLHGRFQARRIAQHIAHFIFQDLGIEQLLAVLPFVQGLGFIQTFVTLHADQRQAQPGRAGQCQFGLANTGGAFDQDRLGQIFGHEDRGGDLPGGDIALIAKPGDDVFHVVEFGCAGFCHGSLFNHLIYGLRLRSRLKASRSKINHSTMSVHAFAPAGLVPWRQCPGISRGLDWRWKARPTPLYPTC